MKKIFIKDKIMSLVNQSDNSNSKESKNSNHDSNVSGLCFLSKIQKKYDEGSLNSSIGSLNALENESKKVSKSSLGYSEFDLLKSNKKISNKINRLFILRNQDINDKFSYDISEFLNFIFGFDIKCFFLKIINLVEKILKSNLSLKISNLIITILEDNFKKDFTQIKQIYKSLPIVNEIQKNEKNVVIQKSINPILQYESKYKKLKKLENLKKRLKVYEAVFSRKSILKEIIDSTISQKIIECKTNSSTQRRYLINYIKQTKSIYVFDIIKFKLENHNISNLPFSFNRDSQAIEIYKHYNDLLAFISGGGNNQYTSEMYCYNINKASLETWESMSISRGYHSMIANRDYLYVIGGSNTSDGISKFNKTVDIYNIKTKKRLKVNCEVNSARSDPGLTVLNDIIYMVAGVNFENKDPIDIECFDTRSIQGNGPLKWKTLSVKLPRPFYGPTCVNISSNEFIFGGGENKSHQMTKDLYIYNVDSDTFKNYITNLPEGGEYINIGGFINLKAYFFDFNNEEGSDYSIHEFNINNKIWKTFRVHDLIK